MAGGRDSFTFVPFFRYDSRDSERSHFDLREVYWQRATRSWELAEAQDLSGIDGIRRLLPAANRAALERHRTSDIGSRMPRPTSSLPKYIEWPPNFWMPT